MAAFTKGYSSPFDLVQLLKRSLLCLFRFSEVVLILHTLFSLQSDVYKDLPFLPQSQSFSSKLYSRSKSHLNSAFRILNSAFPQRIP